MIVVNVLEQSTSIYDIEHTETMDYLEIVKKAFEMKGIPYEEVGPNTLATNLSNGRVFFVMCIGDEIEIGLSHPDFYNRIDSRRATIAGRKSVAGIKHIEYSGAHGEPMFGTAVKADDASAPEIATVLEDMLNDLNKAMDGFDRLLRLRQETNKI